MLDLEEAEISPEEFCKRAKAAGLLIRPILKNSVRLVFIKESPKRMQKSLLIL